MSDSLQPDGLQHMRLPCPSMLKVMSIESVMPSKHLTLCCSLVLLPSIFPISGIFQMSWLFKSGDQIIVPSVSASVLPVSIQAWYPLGLTGSISLLSKALSRIFSNTTIWSVVPLSFLNPAYTSGSSWFMCCSLSNVLLRKSGEIAPERMKRQSQSGRDTLLWMCLVVKVKSDFVENNTA